MKRFEPLAISISDPAYRRLAIRINKRWLFMSEEDIDWIISSVLKTKAIVDRRPKEEGKK